MKSGNVTKFTASINLDENIELKGDRTAPKNAMERLTIKINDLNKIVNDQKGKIGTLKTPPNNAS